MSFGLSTSLKALLPNSAGALFNFAAATTVKSVRLTNVNTTAETVTLYFDYTSTSTGDTETVMSALVIAPGESVTLDGGPWNFASGGRVSGFTTTANKVSIHITPATI